MKIDGRVASGLDEFMLRLGHLKVLVATISSTGGNRERISKRLASQLTKPVSVGGESLQDLGMYLARKELASVLQPDGTMKSARPNARYGDLIVEMSSNGAIERIAGKAREATPIVWFEDSAIASRETRSKVGAVTVDREQLSNKSGVSHLVDWAVILGLVNQRLGLSSFGRTLKLTLEQTRIGTEYSNPYVIGPERLVFAWALFVADGDVLVRLLPLLEREKTVTKATAVGLMLEVFRAFQEEMPRNSGGASASALRALRALKEDLGLRRGRSGAQEASPSTVWHRMASRLETLTDLGLLEKATATGEDRQFDYYYRTTTALSEAVRRLLVSDSLMAWVGADLADLMGLAQGVTLRDVFCGEELISAALLSAGPTGIQIDAFALLASTLALSRGKRLPVTGARRAMESLAGRRPDLARLSRGYSGAGAEFASVSLSKIEAEGPAVFEEQ